MFDFSFAELVVIGVVALLVIGPERLPQVARTAGRWVGRAQRFMNKLADDINKEMEVEKIRKIHESAQAHLVEIDKKIQNEQLIVNEALTEAERRADAIGMEARPAKRTDNDADIASKARDDELSDRKSVPTPPPMPDKKVPTPPPMPDRTVR